MGKNKLGQTSLKLINYKINMQQTNFGKNFEIVWFSGYKISGN